MARRSLATSAGLVRLSILVSFSSRVSLLTHRHVFNGRAQLILVRYPWRLAIKGSQSGIISAERAASMSVSGRERGRLDDDEMEEKGRER